MSRVNKLKNKRRHRVPHARLVGNKVELTGARGGRTKKLHNKIQQYPKTVLLGKGQWKWAN